MLPILLTTNDMDPYLWIVVFGGIFAFFAGCGIGANDVANAFATSVGSKALTLKQAVLLAAVFEFAGAVLMGSHVTKTIRKGISDYECFTDKPAVLMDGMMCVVLAVGIWLFVASYFELPVSTTHSCVGGVIFMTLAATNDRDCVIWYEETDEFPYMKGVSAVVLSWVLSPVFSAVAACALFLVIRTFVLRSSRPFDYAIISYPLIIMSVLVVNIFYIIYKGGKGLDTDETTVGEALAYAFGIGGGVALCTIPLMMKLKEFINNDFEGKQQGELEGGLKSIELTKKTKDGHVAVGFDDSKDANVLNGGQNMVAGPAEKTEEAPKKGFFTRMFSWNEHLDNLNDKIHKTHEECNTTASVHDNAEVFDEKAESVYRFVQIFTAICDSFAHGANDVANAMGPFAAIYVIYSTNEVSKKAELGDNAYWILAIGGCGIVVGLALYGYKIVRAIGVKLAKITPTRGSCIELGSALVIITGSKLGIPLSTTHCQVGATVGVALLEGKKGEGINCTVFLKTLAGWVLTLVIVGAFTVTVFSFQVYAPSVNTQQ